MTKLRNTLYCHSLNCGHGSMVELELPKLTTRVRFPSPAPWNPKPGTCSLAFFVYENVAGLESVKCSQVD